MSTERIAILLRALGLDPDSFNRIVEWALTERLVSEVGAMTEVRALISEGGRQDMLREFRRLLRQRTSREWTVQDSKALLSRIRQDSIHHDRAPIRYEEAVLLRLRDPLVCRHCGKAPPEVQLHIDHVVPASKGGASTHDNLQFLCAKCNLRKSNKREVGSPWLELT